jgi:hypothetical protein
MSGLLRAREDLMTADPQPDDVSLPRLAFGAITKGGTAVPRPRQLPHVPGALDPLDPKGARRASLRFSGPRSISRQPGGIHAGAREEAGRTREQSPVRAHRWGSSASLLRRRRTETIKCVKKFVAVERPAGRLGDDLLHGLRDQDERTVLTTLRDLVAAEPPAGRAGRGDVDDQHLHVAKGSAAVRFFRSLPLGKGVGHHPSGDRHLQEGTQQGLLYSLRGSRRRKRRGHPYR